MPIEQLLNTLKSQAPFCSKDADQEFLNTLSNDDQMACISALYIGRSHIHESKLINDYLHMDRKNCDHINQSDYARILYEKNTNLITYIDALLLCANNSNLNWKSF